MKIDRLFKIVYILLDKKFITAQYLAEHFQVSSRTIYRDIDVLTLAGIPIYTNKGKGGGIGLLDQYVLSKSLLNNKERQQLLVGLQSVEATGYEEVNDVMMKLRGIFKEDSDSWIEIDFSNWSTTDKGKKSFDQLKKSMVNSEQISFNYINSNGKNSHRRVFPLKLIFKKKDWYLQAYCTKKEENRFFKAKRINNIEFLGNHFDRKKYINKNNIYPVNRSNEIDLNINISKLLTHRVYDEFDRDNIKITETGDYNIKITIEENQWLHHYLLSFEEHLKIISPLHLNDKIKNILQKTLKNYQ